MRTSNVWSMVGSLHCSGAWEQALKPGYQAGTTTFCLPLGGNAAQSFALRRLELLGWVRSSASPSPRWGYSSGASPSGLYEYPESREKPEYNSCPLAEESGEAGNKSKAPRWESVGFPLGRAKLNKPRCSSARSRRAGFPRGSPSSTPVSLSVNLTRTPPTKPRVGSRHGLLDPSRTWSFGEKQVGFFWGFFSTSLDLPEVFQRGADACGASSSC